MGHFDGLSKCLSRLYVLFLLLLLILLLRLSYILHKDSLLLLIFSTMCYSLASYSLQCSNYVYSIVVALIERSMVLLCLEDDLHNSTFNIVVWEWEDIKVVLLISLT